MRLRVSPTFVKGRNFAILKAMVEWLLCFVGEGKIGMLANTPGTGKTVTSQAVSSNLGGIYLRVASVWEKSKLAFLQALCVELGAYSPPSRKHACYSLAIERLCGTDRVVFIDEATRLPKDFFNVILDLSDVSGCPFILVGEPELQSMMMENKRVWSRTHRKAEFQPLAISDVALYAKQAIGIEFSQEVANILHASSGGDWRILKRDVIALVDIVNAHGFPDMQSILITPEMVRIATSLGLKGGTYS